jgi:hypothetical protein
MSTVHEGGSEHRLRARPCGGPQQRLRGSGPLY